MCTIIFIAKIPLQFKIKPEHPLRGPYLGLAGDQNGPHTPCFTRNETLLTALLLCISGTSYISVCLKYFMNLASSTFIALSFLIFLFWALFLKHVVRTKFDIYVFITITGWWTISPGVHNLPSRQCFNTDTV